jgi:hypothetical protein
MPGHRVGNITWDSPFWRQFHPAPLVLFGIVSLIKRTVDYCAACAIDLLCGYPFTVQNPLKFGRRNRVDVDHTVMVKLPLKQCRHLFHFNPFSSTSDPFF